MGHNTEQQTWDYIHEVIDAEERKNRLKGGNLLGNSQKPHKYALDANWEKQKTPKTLYLSAF